MTTVSDLCSWMERFAPLVLAEDWDNVGLLLGDRQSTVERLMTCLTVTPQSAAEAIARKAELIVTHHPILFRPTQKLTTDREDSAVVWRLANAGIAVYSPHTAFDNAEDGINVGLAKRLMLDDVRPLRKSRGETEFKVVVFTPETDRDPILKAAFAAGAGQIGNYDECSFSAEGLGTFWGLEGSNPTIGQAGHRESVREWQVEFVCASSCLDRVLEAVRKAHSYEEPAIDVLPLRERKGGLGKGRIGRLADRMTLNKFVHRVRDQLGCSSIEIVGDPASFVREVAIGCGAGDDFVRDAARTGANVLVTGEARFHRALEADALGIALVLVGHYHSERPAVEDLALGIKEAFPELDVWPSEREANPLKPA